VTEPPPSIAALEAQADAAEEAMYDARPRLAKDHRDDALAFLHRAAAEAERLGLADEVLRLRARRDNLLMVWDHQFRGASD
jgi:hypothetical protein